MDFSRSSFIILYNILLFVNEITEFDIQGGYFIQNITFPFNNLNKGHSERLTEIISGS